MAFPEPPSLHRNGCHGSIGGGTSRASLLKTPQQVLAVFRQPDEETDISVISHSLCLALDDVQDPGNLGTIVRLADWFGIEHIFCSPNTVDIYNPKTVQATMEVSHASDCIILPYPSSSAH